MARDKEIKSGMRNRATGAVDYFLPYRLADAQNDEPARLMNHAVDKYDAVQQAMRDRAGRGRATGISYTDPVTGRMKEFRRGDRPASRITINGKTFSGDDVYKARGAAKQYAADYRKRSEFRDAMISLANPNDPKGQKLIKATNAWFDSGREISDKMRADFGNIVKGRYAKIQEAAGRMKPGDFLDFRQEQEKRADRGMGPSDSPGQAAPLANGQAPGARGSGQPPVPAGSQRPWDWNRPTTANRTSGIDRSEGRAREQAERDRANYFASGRGQRDYWQSRLQNAMQLKEADDARRMHSDLLKLMATSRKYGINLDEGQVDTSGMSNYQGQPRQAVRPVPSPSLPSDSAYWRYRDKPDVGVRTREFRFDRDGAATVNRAFAQGVA